MLNAKGLFGSGVEAAKDATRHTTVPEGVTVEAVQAYREIALRNIDKAVHQVRIQIIDRMLEMMRKQ